MQTLTRSSFCLALLAVFGLHAAGAAEFGQPSVRMAQAQYDDAMPAGPAGIYGPAGPYDEGRPNQNAARLKYRGFQLDLSGVGETPNVSNAIAAVEHQIDIVDGVGLTAANEKLFRSLPIRVSNRPFGNGHFKGGHEVEVGGFTAADNRPILLHEYMHAYQFYRLPGGFHNADVIHFYTEAVNNNLYEPGAFMLTNPGEFFAVTASCYLYGTVARAPYNRDTIRTAQPDYYAYLGRLFGRAVSQASPSARRLHAAAPRVLAPRG